MRTASLVGAAIAVTMSAMVALPNAAQASTSHVYEAMPNFVGMVRSGVYSEMFSAQLYFKTTGLGANSSRWVRVVSEIPAAGTMIHPFSTVILKVTTMPAPVAVAAVRRTTTAHPLKKTTVALTATAARTLQRTRPTSSRTAHPRAMNVREGVATWYSYIPGQCASWYLPHGTRISVEDLRSHRVISCVVTDREAAHGDRVVDLSETQFAQLEPLGVGVVPVRVTW